ncbi:hypothetical protein EVAR_5429_1 [Eumeta japonica]|uniref:RNA-directed DNA polymerase from mobile element jockey n=1 Tax=Eumeta variegata TaxID=151549 RepID=A0A4C1TB79_EUMVA|nr:hypothetical protein EVAR_5429_1 [Eumeta japonica]
MPTAPPRDLENFPDLVEKTQAAPGFRIPPRSCALHQPVGENLAPAPPDGHIGPLREPARYGPPCRPPLLQSTYYPVIATNRPSTLDIALTKGVALNLNWVEILHCLLSDHRPILLKMRPPDDGSPNTTLKITDWKRVSTVLEKIDIPYLNSIPDNINTTDKIDSAIDALTNHVRSMVEKSE